MIFRVVLSDCGVESSSSPLVRVCFSFPTAKSLIIGLGYAERPFRAREAHVPALSPALPVFIPTLLLVFFPAASIFFYFRDDAERIS